MVDCYGRWTEEQDYSKYPEEKMCDYDYMAIYSSLTPVEMREYMEADVQLHYMEIQKRKEQREIKENAVGIKRFLKVLLGV